MSKRLVETMEIIAFIGSRGLDCGAEAFAQHIAAIQGLEYAELTVLLTAAQFVYLTHQTCHWQAKGDPFYGDHLLFERLYNATLEDVDSLAERAVGKGTVQNVDLAARIGMLSHHVAGESPALPSPRLLAEKAMAAEVLFLSFAGHAVESLKAKGMLSRGIDQLIGGIEDKHEGHIYLLKQRLSA